MSEERETLSIESVTQRLYLRNLAAMFAREQTFRKFLWETIREAGIYYPTIVSGDAVMSAFYEGKRSQGLDILHLMQNALEGKFLAKLHEEFGDSQPKSRPKSKPQGEDDVDPQVPDDPPSAAV